MRADYQGEFEVKGGRKYRLAEISFDPSEWTKLERIVKLMGIKGWQIDIVTDGYASCIIEDRREYDLFMEDWKASKRCITNCMKYGF